MYMFCSGIG